MDTTYQELTDAQTYGVSTEASLDFPHTIHDEDQDGAE